MTGTAPMSRVLRVCVSKVRMPLSQRMTCGLPPFMMYSAESSSSSMVPIMLRLQEHGRARLPQGLQEREVLHVARAHLEHARVAAHQLHVVLRQDLGHHGQAVALCRGAQDLQALLPQALEGVRRGARLEGAAAHELQPGALQERGGGLHLLLGLHGAGPGNDGEASRANGHAAHGDPRGVGMELPGGKLVRLEHAQHAFHAGQLVELGLVQGAVVTGDAADGLDRAAAQVRGIAEVLDLAQNGSGSAPRLRLS